MMEMWGIILSALIGVMGFFLRFIWTELQRIQILLNRTREEIARDCVTWERRDRKERGER